MIILPFRKFYIETSLSLDDVAARMHYNIETDKINKRIAGVPTRHFEGQLTYDNMNNRYEFELYRLLNHWKHLPFGVQGAIIEAGNKTRVEVQIELDFVHLLSLMIWLGLIVMSIIGQVLSGDFSTFPVVIFVFGTVVFAFSYLPEARRNRDLMLEITKGKVVNQYN
jgi:hypothetical protein